MAQTTSTERANVEEVQTVTRRKKNAPVEEERSSGGISPAYFVAGGGAVIFGGAIFYLWQKITALEGKGDAPNREVRDLAAYVYNMEATHAEAIRKLHAEVQAAKKTLEDATKLIELQKNQIEAITKSHNLLAGSFSSKPWERVVQQHYPPPPQYPQERERIPRQHNGYQQPRETHRQNGARYNHEEEEGYSSEDVPPAPRPPTKKPIEKKEEPTRLPKEKKKPKESSLPIQEDTMAIAKKMMAEIEVSGGED